MRVIPRLLAVVATSALLVAPAAAQDYTFTLAGAVNASFTLPASPVPTQSVSSTVFVIENLTISQESIPNYGCAAYFYVIPNNNMSTGSFSYQCSSSYQFESSDVASGQLFTGDVSAPTFKLGTFSLLYQGSENVSLTIASGASVPEPSAPLLLGAGLAGLAAARRRRRTTTP